MQAPEGWRPAWVSRPSNARRSAACERAERCVQGAPAPSRGRGCAQGRKGRRTMRRADVRLNGTGEDAVIDAGCATNLRVASQGVSREDGR